jgi:two-component system, chemotaxis family, chemotaxis protein CheY
MIIVVDDVDFMRIPLMDIINNLGEQNVVGLKNGKELLDYYIELEDKSSIKAIILDQMMPIMSGIDALKELRKYDNNVPVILFSGLLKEEVVIKATRLGVKDFLNKPIIEEQVIKVIEKYTEK